MKTFADFIVEAKKQTKKPDYKQVYADKVASVRERHNDYIKSHKDRVRRSLEKRQEAENRKKEEEKENQEYISHIEGIKKEIKQQVKREYGIKD